MKKEEINFSIFNLYEKFNQTSILIRKDEFRSLLEKSYI